MDMSRTPTYVSDDARMQALGPTSHLPPLLQALYASSSRPNESSQPARWFTPLQRPAAGDWLDEHRESGQSYASFARKTNASRPSAKRAKLLLVPVGTFPPAAIDVLGLARVAAAFFDCPVILAKPLSLGMLQAKSRAGKSSGTKAKRFHRKGDEGQDQLHAGLILNELKTFRARDRRYADCFAVMGFTMVDLFPRESWNFVYGLAFASAGAGIFSFARYRDDGAAWPTLADASDARFEVEECEVQPGDAGSATSPLGNPAAVDTVLRQMAGAAAPTPPDSVSGQRHYGGFMRACTRVLCHESCHLLGMRHCIFFFCLMNGSNHEEEATRRPLRLCPVCLRKLAHCLLPGRGRPGTSGSDAVPLRAAHTKRLPAPGPEATAAGPGRGNLKRAQSTGSLLRPAQARAGAGVAFGRSASFKVPGRLPQKPAAEEAAWGGARGASLKEEQVGEVLLRRYVRLGAVMGEHGMEEEAEWVAARVSLALRHASLAASGGSTAVGGQGGDEGLKPRRRPGRGETVAERERGGAGDAAVGLGGADSPADGVQARSLQVGTLTRTRAGELEPLAAPHTPPPSSLAVHLRAGASRGAASDPGPAAAARASVVALESAGSSHGRAVAGVDHSGADGRSGARGVAFESEAATPAADSGPERQVSSSPPVLPVGRGGLRTALDHFGMVGRTPSGRLGARVPSSGAQVRDFCVPVLPGPIEALLE